MTSTMKSHSSWIVRDDGIRAHCMVSIAQLDLSKPWSVEIKPYRKKRSLSQNSMYWAEINYIVEAIADVTGYGSGEIHDLLKRKFLTPTIVEIGGEKIEHYTTTTLDTSEMSNYMERVRAFASSELGIVMKVAA